jgi:hypothetical protein
MMARGFDPAFSDQPPDPSRFRQGIAVSVARMIRDFSR